MPATLAPVDKRRAQLERSLRRFLAEADSGLPPAPETSEQTTVES